MKKLSIISLAAAALVGCSTAETDLAHDCEVQITSSIATRVSGVKWDAGDEIGVYMSTTDGTELGDLGYNTLYTTEIGDGRFTTAATPLYYPVSGTVDILAYYPYKAKTGLNKPIDPTSYLFNVTQQDDLSANDIMRASANSVAKSETAVDLTFEHMLSYINVELKAGEGVTEADLKNPDILTKINLAGTKGNGEIDFTKGDDECLKLLSTINDFKMNLTRGDEGVRAEAIAIPQVLSGARFIVTLKINNQLLEFDAPITTPEFTIGDRFDYTLTVSKSDVVLSAGRIDAWESGGAVEDMEAVLPPPPAVVEVTNENYEELGVSVDAVGCWVLYAERSDADATNITENSLTAADDLYTHDEDDATNAIYKKLLIASADISGEKNWDDACFAANSYDDNSYADWRLPTKKELELISQYKGGLSFLQNSYWSATSLNDINAWHVSFYDGNAYSGGTDFGFYVRPVHELPLN